VLDAIIFIKEMDVHRHHQQQGLGRALISTAQAAALSRAVIHGRPPPHKHKYLPQNINIPFALSFKRFL
jgi:GNAT superfamily N-acetyltransferase